MKWPKPAKFRVTHFAWRVGLRDRFTFVIFYAEWELRGNRRELAGSCGIVCLDPWDGEVDPVL